MTSKFEYAAWVYAELDRILRSALIVGQSLRRVSLEEDFGGIDCHYVINQCCPVALRARFDRPPYAADSDITFRSTEPRMIAAETYAPLAMFAWFSDHHIVAAKIVDIYRMAAEITPSLDGRYTQSNGDGTAFLVVEMSELWVAQAILRTFDGNAWNTPVLAGNLRLQQIVNRYRRQAS